MERKFILSCESTIDLPYSYTLEREIPVIFYSYFVDGVEHADDMGKDPTSLDKFYELIDAKKLPTTSQINVETYRLYLEELVKKGDVMHIAFGTGMSASVRNAMLAAEMLKEDYPDRKIIVIDSYCSSSGYGMLVDYAADLRDEGRTIEETEKWVLDNCKHIHHQFFCTDLSFFKRSGRVSGATATIATVLNICPIMRLDDLGRIIAYDKVRGKKNAIAEIIATMDRHIRDGQNYDEKLWVCHSGCREMAEEFVAALEEHYPKQKGKIRICDIGPIIVSHCGRGTVAAFFLGDERAPEKCDKF